MITPQTLKGFRDLLPPDAAIKKKAVLILSQTFEQFGFQPLETPTLEYASTLLGKYGEEADKLVYTFKDRGAREIGLRYDLTVPVCKVLAIYQNELPLPFKRYQIQNSFRAEKPQKGRFREFTQCDVDIFGVKNWLADAEIITVTYKALKNLGFSQFVINISSREVLTRILDNSEITDDKLKLSVMQTIDKLGKKSKEEVELELKNKGIEAEKIKNIFSEIENAKPNEELLNIFSFLEKNGIKKDFFTFSPFMVRGLDYYTRTIYETYVTEPKIGSLTGGGRYDNLVKQLGGPDITGTGTTIGLERIIEVIKELNLWNEITTSVTKVLVTVFSKELLDNSIKMASQLRTAEISAELFLDPEKKLDKQLKYADKKGIPWVIIIGPEEQKQNKIVLKNLKTKKQEIISIDQAIHCLS